MKAKLKAKILGVDKNATFRGSTDVANMVKLRLESNNGKVDSASISAQFAALTGDLFLREVIANQVKIGATLTITISDEDTNAE